MRLAIVGTGYVGLTTGTCLAELGHNVVCMDTDAAKVAALQQGRIPFFEAKLPELVDRNLDRGRLRFTTDLQVALAEAEAVFLCVGTPSTGNGASDLSMLFAATASIGRTVARPLIVIQKSTAPVGTLRRLEEIIQEQVRLRGLNIPIHLVSNPEFLREGSAVQDFLHPDRVVVGGSSSEAVELVASLYRPLLPPERILCMDGPSAEMAKYASNAFLATKISFINEVANLCEVLGADIENVRRAMGADHRIGPYFLHPGVGYGGACFPKDVSALIHAGVAAGYTPEILQAVHRVNILQRRRLVQRIATCLAGHTDSKLTGRRIAIWGLSFKPGTDDMREAPAITVIEELIRRGAVVRAYDPIAMVNAHKLFNGTVQYASDPYDCADATEAVVLLTEWPEFAQADLQTLRARMTGYHLFDARNALDPDAVTNAGFTYHAVGRPRLGDLISQLAI